MKFSYQKARAKRKEADCLFFPFFEGVAGVESAASLPHSISQALEVVFAAGDFKAKEGEAVCIYLKGEAEKRLFLIGLGKKETLSAESLRCAYAAAVKQAIGKKLQSVNLVLPEGFQGNCSDWVKAIAEGVLLANYSYTGFKKPTEHSLLLEKIHWIGANQAERALIESAAATCKGVYYARDLVNGTSDWVTPQHLADSALALAQEHPSLKVTVWDKKRIAKEGMGFLLAVNRGSDLEPAFIIASYRGNPKSEEVTVLVGKGVTFDTGGLNLKPTGGMETMKCDMAGAAACLGILVALTELQLKVNVTVLIPSTENSIGSRSFKPGDVCIGLSGKSVEVTNTDAEGRLILADALTYACTHLHPTYLINLATLTGAIEVALGPEASGLMSNQDQLAENLLAAGDKSFERVWRMPLFPEYRQRLRSDIADLKNWNGRAGGACVAGAFLQEFVAAEVPWAHLDIAATAYFNEVNGYRPKYGTGVGVRLIIEFLISQAQS